MLSPRYDEALAYAAALHAGQSRKASDVPYLAHLLGVSALVLEDGGSETEAIAALLHDALEDQPRDGRTRVEIAERFGPEVLRIVLACTDDDGSGERTAANWRARKERYIAHLAHARSDERHVALADKLNNVRAIVGDLERVGEDVWVRFRGGRAGTRWYYRALADLFARTDRGPLVTALRDAVSLMERLSAD